MGVFRPTEMNVRDLLQEELRRPWPHDVIVSIATSPKTEYVVTAIFKD